MGRPRMPEWFTSEDSAFFKEVITPAIWENIRSTYNHDALREECEAAGIPIESIKHYWYKSKRISLFSKTDGAPINQQQVFTRLLASFQDYQLPSFTFPAQSLSKNCAIINLYDAHLDKISIRGETGENITMQDNIDRYVKGFDNLLASVLTHDPEQIIFPIGNDLFHANDMTGRTKRGTQIQYLCIPEEAYSEICKVIVGCVAKLAQTGAKVVIPFVKGNHDEDNVTILGFWLRELFKANNQITFLPGRLQRNYIRYGANLFGFAHGDKEKSKISDLPLLMAQEVPQQWAATKYRKFLCGDLHHEFEYKFLSSKDRPGVQIAFLRSVGGSDKWHVDHGWIGIPKTAYAEIWDKENGEKAGFKVNL